MEIPEFFAGALQGKANRVIRAKVNDCLAGRELNQTLWSLLVIVAEARDGIRLTEVAKLLGVKAPLITMMADQLIARELISRVPHQLDKRAKLLMITSTGKKFVSTLEAEVDKQLSRLLKGVTKKDLLIYKKVLTTIVSNEQTRA